MGRLGRFVWALTRRKPMNMSEDATDLDRCLNTVDLTAMGVGATLGFGLYVLSGEVAAQKAGPAVVISFMIAAIASTLNALCYAEFAAKVPRAGSAYAYSYITVGEFVAFVIGWNLTLEHIIGTACLARGYSNYLRSILDPIIESAPNISPVSSNESIENPLVSSRSNGNASESTLAMQTSVADLVHQVDWLSFSMTMLVTGLILFGIKVSSKVQISFAAINLTVAYFVIVCGLFKADFHNWRLTKEEIPTTAGEGGFLPFGWTGVISGAGTCFFAFIGFDGIAAIAEEVKNPRKAIPRSILWTSVIIFITYSFMSSIQTLIWPYWDQKQAAPLPYIFDKLGMHFAKWIILAGVLAALSATFIGGMLPLPRILFAMARDGVIYRVLAVVEKRFKVPIVATIVGGTITACMASMLDIDQLADMLSIGTLAAYSLVSISVLLLRYEYRKPETITSVVPNTIQEIENQIDKIKDLMNQQAAKRTRPSSNGLKTSKDAIPTENNTQEAAFTVNGFANSLSSNDGPKLDSGSSPRNIWSLFVNGRKEIIGDADGMVLRPDEQTTHISRLLILVLCIATTLLAFALFIWGPALGELKILPVSSFSLLVAAIILLGYLLNRLPVAEASTNSFEVPLVPTIPLFSVIINTYLMINLSVMTWIRFAVWMAIGFFIYFTYGIRKSTGYKDSRCE